MIALILLALILAACSPAPQTFSATVAPTRIGGGAPVYTATPTLTATVTLTPTFTLTPTATLTVTPSPTFTPTLTPTLTPTPRLLTLTPASAQGAPAAYIPPPLTPAATAGWGCGDFPCADDVSGFLRRIVVPDGYEVAHVGRFPSQPQQITYGPDGRLYATVWEDSSMRTGAVYAMDAAGNAVRYAGDFNAPVGLAFQPGTDILYVSSRLEPLTGGALWRIEADDAPVLVLDDLPCCFGLIDNQPNGLVFGPDGYLYMGIGALTDHAEPPDASRAQYAEIQPDEAAILRIQPHTGAVETYAEGLRNPFDLTFDTNGQFYATDQGLVSGPGDRLLTIAAGGHYGWPYWRTRGCETCPVKPSGLEISADTLTFEPFTLPRGVVAYTANQFPLNMFNAVFVALWHGTENGQQVAVFQPGIHTPDAPAVTPFMTGLIRPIDVAIAPDGRLIVADFIYGHVWAVRYIGA